ncbi:MAG: TonB C-terminal domain-containing protein [candidate division Zixibacteria bacterium]|nr:TonB C-terminal domain-containing protein [candidate division Zixibacteria bacterium]
MKLELILSFLLHLLIILTTVISAPFQPAKTDFGEIIRVSITAPSELPSSQPEPLPPIPVPSPVFDEPLDIPISDPAVAKPVKVEQKEKPKEKKTVRRAQGETTTEPEQVEVPGTGSGTPFGGAKIDNASFDYPYWFRQAFNKLSQSFRNPIAFDGTLVCTIYFQVIKSGRVVDVRVEESSGILAFDDACLAAVERSAPFPPLPREFTDEIIGITVPFTNR